MYNINKAVKLDFTLGFARICRLKYLTNHLRELQETLFRIGDNCKDSKIEILLVKEYSERLKKEIKKTKGNIKRLEKMDFKDNSGINESDIQQAKNAPVEAILGEPARRNQGVKFYHSPLRNKEKTPSFAVYEGGNWVDFGTGEKGDLIDLTKLLCGYTFIKSVKYLCSLC